MIDGYTMFGSSKKPILIKNDKVEIVYDRTGVKIVPKKLEEFNFMSMDFLTAHSILCHHGKLRTKATALKLGWKVRDDDVCEDCLLGKNRERNVKKK